MANTTHGPAPHAFVRNVTKEAMQTQPWAVALQQQSNDTLINALHEQFDEVDALLQTQAVRYNRNLLSVVSSIQHSPTKDKKLERAKEALSPLCRFEYDTRTRNFKVLTTKMCRIPIDEVFLPVESVCDDSSEREKGARHDGAIEITPMPMSQSAGAGIDDTVKETRLVDSDEEDNVGMNAMPEQGKDGKLVINGVDGRVALPGFEVGLMSRNSMKESLENAVQSFRSKSVVS